MKQSNNQTVKQNCIDSQTCPEPELGVPPKGTREGQNIFQPPQTPGFWPHPALLSQKSQIGTTKTNLQNKKNGIPKTGYKLQV